MNASCFWKRLAAAGIYLNTPAAFKPRGRLRRCSAVQVPCSLAAPGGSLPKGEN